MILTDEERDYCYEHSWGNTAYTKTKAYGLAIEKAILSKIEERLKTERERCAVTAWSTGMDLYMKQFDAREIGSACAHAIRDLK